MSLRLAVVTLLLFLMSSAPAPAHGAEGETEARIAARVLADGRIEMALQQREAGEAWGALLPAGVRFLRPFAETGRWLVSVPVGLAAEGSDRGPSGGGLSPDPHEVRIAARRLDNGRIEFALDQRGAGGVWSERSLPRAR